MSRILRRDLHELVAGLDHVSQLLGIIIDAQYDDRKVAESDISNARRMVQHVTRFLETLRLDGDKQ
jgi:hypothetical protein